jgi:hypothetical protein
MLEHAEGRPPVLRRPLAEPVDAIARRQPADDHPVETIALVIAQLEVAFALHPAGCVIEQLVLRAGSSGSGSPELSNSYDVIVIP